MLLLSTESISRTDASSYGIRRKCVCGLIVLTILSLAVIVIGVSVGSTHLPLWDVYRVFFSRATGEVLPADIPKSTESIVFQLRLPRVLLAFLTGAALSVGGAVTQSVLSNPLASPYTLGVSSGASVGAAIAVVLGVGISLPPMLSLAIIGTVFGVLTVAVCISIASRLDRNLGSATIVLLGMVLSLFLSSVFTLIAGLSKDKMTMLLRWQMGSFGSKGWEAVAVLTPVAAVCIVIVMYLSRELDIMSFGDEAAMSMGVRVRRVKGILLIVTAVLTGTAVSFAGVIGFIDLIAPHAARKLFCAKHVFLCPACALMGGSFMVISDMIARIAVSNTELPVGVITSLVGAPFFAYIFFTRRKSDA